MRLARSRREPVPLRQRARVRGMARAWSVFWVGVLGIWMSAWTTELAHPAMAAHVFCEVHGQVEDVPAFSGAAPDVRSTLDAAYPDPGDHHACPLVGAPGPTVAWVAPTWTPAPPLDPPVAVALIPTTAPRPPPLGYAPKTSPPSVS